MTRLHERLDTCARKGGLSTADLAVWFDLPYPTIRSYREGTQPNAARAPQIEQRLVWLERAIKDDPQLPVPLSVRAGDRRAFIEGVLGRVVNKR